MYGRKKSKEHKPRYFLKDGRLINISGSEVRVPDGAKELTKEEVKDFLLKQPKKEQPLPSPAKPNYPPIEDQLDALWKHFAHERLTGRQLIQPMDDMLGKILAEKDRLKNS